MQRMIMRILGVISICVAASALAYPASAGPDEALLFIHGGAVYSVRVDPPRMINERISLANERIGNISVSRKGQALLNPSGMASVAPSRDTVMQSRDKLMVAYLKNDDGQSLSPDGSRVVSIARADSDKQVLRLEEMPDGKVRDLSAAYYDIQVPTWSPDGKKIAYYCSIGKGLSLRVYDLIEDRDIEVARESRTITFSGDFREPVVWSPDNACIYFWAGYEDDGRVPSLPSVYKAWADGSHSPKLIMAGAICTCISSDGLTLYVSNRNIYTVRVDMEPAQVTLLIPDGNHPQISPSGKFLAYNRLGGGTWCRILDTGVDVRVGPNDHAYITQFLWTTLPAE